MSKRWYAIGPVQTVDDPIEGSYQCAPEGCVGWIDTRPVTGEVASGFFAFDVRPEHLKETHTIIGDGTRLEEYYPTLAERSAWASAYAVPVNPASDTLLQMLVSLLTEQADPDGLERCRPLTVDHRGNYEIHLGGHSRIFRSKFQGEKDRLWPNLQRLWQSELSKTHTAEAKRGADADMQTGKMLCELARLHRCPAKLLTPKELQGLKPRKPTTQLYDDFERADLQYGVVTNPQPGDLWLATSNRLWLISNGHAYYDGTVDNGMPDSMWGRTFYNAPLSSANQAVTSHVENVAEDYIGMLGRCNVGSTTCYGAWISQVDARIRLLYNDASVGLSTIDPVSVGGSATQKLTVDGSTLMLYQDGALLGSATNTALSSGLYVGLCGHYINITTTMRCDWWSARDLLAASIPLLLRNTRAV